MFPQRQPPQRTTSSGEGTLISWLSDMVKYERGLNERKGDGES